jgi:hypothetical protein
VSTEPAAGHGEVTGGAAHRELIGQEKKFKNEDIIQVNSPVDPENEFRYWQSVTDKEAVAADQAKRFSPDDLIPRFPKLTPVPELFVTEREGLRAWFEALAKASPKRADAERYRALVRTHLKELT